MKLLSPSFSLWILVKGNKLCKLFSVLNNSSYIPGLGNFIPNYCPLPGISLDCRAGVKTKFWLKHFLVQYIHLAGSGFTDFGAQWKITPEIMGENRTVFFVLRICKVIRWEKEIVLQYLVFMNFFVSQTFWRNSELQIFLNGFITRKELLVANDCRDFRIISKIREMGW